MNSELSVYIADMGLNRREGYNQRTLDVLCVSALSHEKKHFLLTVGEFVPLANRLAPLLPDHAGIFLRHPLVPLHPRLGKSGLMRDEGQHANCNSDGKHQKRGVSRG